MNEIVLKRKLAEAAQRVVKSREPDVKAFAELAGAMGDLFGYWTGETVRMQITAEGQAEAIDMVKSPEKGAQQ